MRKIEDEAVTGDSLIAMSILLRLRTIVEVGDTRRASRLGESDRRIVSDALKGSVVRVAGIGFVMVVNDDTDGGRFIFLAHFLSSSETKAEAKWIRIRNAGTCIKINILF